MRILLTGGAGFIGSHVADALVTAGCEVVVVDNLSSGSEKNLSQAKELAASKSLPFSLIHADISDATVWQKIPGHFEAFFHFAAQTSVTYSVQKPEFDFKNNVESLLPILRFLRERQVKHFMYANTAGALYGNAEKFPTEEREFLRPLSPYGATKAFTETYIASLSASLKATGEWSSDPAAKNYFSWASLRLGNVFGPRQVTKGEAGVVPIFIEELAAGRAPKIFGDGSKTRDYVFVKDVAAAFLATFKASQRAPIDDAFNLSSGVETSDQEIFDEVFSAVQYRAGEKKEIFWPKKITPTFDKVRPGEVIRSSLSIAKLKAKINYAPSLSFKEALHQTVMTYPLAR